MTDQQRYDDWWCSLAPHEKERIARKIVKKHLLDKADDPIDCTYPECTTVWLSLPCERKKQIFHHCVEDHGLIELLFEDPQPCYT